MDLKSKAKLAESSKIGSRHPLNLFKAARSVANNAYAPYSKFSVGAAVETSDGHIFVGANMENASYGLTICAEVGALQAASSAGVLDKIRRIAIVGGRLETVHDLQGKPTAPCGRCRQLIAEAAMVGGYDIEIWFADLDLKNVERRTISDLLPDSFDATNLK